MLVAAGGAIGALCRYWVGSTAQGLAGDSGFPYGTFIVNLVGCFLIGMYFGVHDRGVPDEFRLLLVVGFLGGFTTFSAFGYETYELIRSGSTAIALGNVVVQCVCGVILVWLGTIVAKAIP